MNQEAVRSQYGNGRNKRKYLVNKELSPESLEVVRPNPKSKILDQVREIMRIKHYSLRTERCYYDWIKRYIRFHGMRSREDLAPGGPKVETLLSHLAVDGNVAASTQNQAFSSLLFLYREV